MKFLATLAIVTPLLLATSVRVHAFPVKMGAPEHPKPCTPFLDEVGGKLGGLALLVRPGCHFVTLDASFRFDPQRSIAFLDADWLKQTGSPDAIIWVIGTCSGCQAHPPVPADSVYTFVSSGGPRSGSINVPVPDGKTVSLPLTGALGFVTTDYGKTFTMLAAPAAATP